MATHYRTATVKGVEIFYREAGPADAPTVVMLHGYPTSSRMYRGLIPMLSDRYRVIAPDYPGFGQSAAPDRSSFDYTHEHLSEAIDDLLDALGVGTFGLYLMDFGGPIGYRIMQARAREFRGVVLQNTPAFGEAASGASWEPLGAYWQDGSVAHREALRATLTLEGYKRQYLDGVQDPTLIDPEGWTIDYALMMRPGVQDIMLDLLYDIRSNGAVVSGAQPFLKANQRRVMVATGVDDPLFPGATMRPPADMPDIEFHGVRSGHFALEDRLDEIGRHTRVFFDRTLGA